MQKATNRQAYNQLWVCETQHTYTHSQHTHTYDRHFKKWCPRWTGAGPGRYSVLTRCPSRQANAQPNTTKRTIHPTTFVSHCCCILYFCIIVKCLANKYNKFHYCGTSSPYKLYWYTVCIGYRASDAYTINYTAYAYKRRVYICQISNVWRLYNETCVWSTKHVTLIKLYFLLKIQNYSCDISSSAFYIFLSGQPAMQ